MAQVIDFVSRKKLIEEKKEISILKKERTLLSFSDVADKNQKAKEKLLKEREQANKNVMKTYKIK
jgi:hypothetical protein